jgi:hypothetical protein
MSECRRFKCIYVRDGKCSLDGDWWLKYLCPIYDEVAKEVKNV